MKNIIIGIVLAVVCFSFLFGMIGYTIGHEAGKNYSNLDVIYSGYLDDIFPESEDEFVQINLRNDSYYVYHNCTQDEWFEWIDTIDVHWDFTLDDFKGYGIWHKTINKNPGGVV